MEGVCDLHYIFSQLKQPVHPTRPHHYVHEQNIQTSLPYLFFRQTFRAVYAIEWTLQAHAPPFRERRCVHAIRAGVRREKRWPHVKKKIRSFD